MEREEEKNKLAEEGSEMSVCLGQTVLVGGRTIWPPNPRTHALCQRNPNPMARPKKSEPRDQQFNLSLTRAELEGIKRRAEALGMRPVHFGRAVLLNLESGPAPASRAEDNNLRLVYAQLIRLGNNLNQMVRHLHRTGDPLPPDVEPLLHEIRQIVARRVAR